MLVVRIINNGRSKMSKFVIKDVGSHMLIIIGRIPATAIKEATRALCHENKIAVYIIGIKNRIPTR
jgi:hypothetical protein